MNEQELRDFITLAFAASGDVNWNGSLLRNVTDAGVRIAKEMRIIKEEKFCEHGFISESYTCSNSDCDNYYEGTKEEETHLKHYDDWCEIHGKFCR